MVSRDFIVVTAKSGKTGFRSLASLRGQLYVHSESQRTRLEFDQITESKQAVYARKERRKEEKEKQSTEWARIQAPRSQRSKENGPSAASPSLKIRERKKIASVCKIRGEKKRKAGQSDLCKERKKRKSYNLLTMPCTSRIESWIPTYNKSRKKIRINITKEENPGQEDSDSKARVGNWV